MLGGQGQGATTLLNHTKYERGEGRESVCRRIIRGPGLITCAVTIALVLGWESTHCDVPACGCQGTTLRESEQQIDPEQVQARLLQL